MENVHNAADSPAAQAVHAPAEQHSDEAARLADAVGDGELTQLGIDGTRANAPKPLSPKAKLTAWALAIGGLLSLCVLIVMAVTVLEWATPYLRYLYFLWLGAGGTEL